MTEEFLYYAWQYRLFDHDSLETASGEKLTILKTGERNSDSGPDFFNARIQLDGQEWAGNLEIHVRTSDWFRHGHEQDKAYGNVILHVVYENDLENFPIPVLELKKKIRNDVYGRYLEFRKSSQTLACSGLTGTIDRYIRSSWLQRMLSERLEEKSSAIGRILEGKNGHWEETFLRFLFSNFGFKTNAQAFEMLSASIPFPVLAKARQDLFTLESLLFGQAGMLEEIFPEEYPQRLRKEYLYLQQKFGLVPMERHSWKFMRMHPNNFPTIRISQLASILHRHPALFSMILEKRDHEDIRKIFFTEASAYWKTHYIFGKRTIEKSVSLGEMAIDSIFINTLSPVLFLYGKYHSDESFTEHALQLPEKIKPEKHTVSAQWKKAGLEAQHAGESQALISLKKNYCDKKRCLDCRIGYEILKGNKNVHPAVK